MAAVAFTADAVFALGSPNGQRKIVRLTFSDVAAAFGIWPSGANDVVVHGKYDSYLVDMNVVVGGTDTSTMEFFLNGISTGQKITNTSSLNSTGGRPFGLAPLRIPAGSMLRITQLA